jgi:hypothetical protein
LQAVTAATLCLAVHSFLHIALRDDLQTRSRFPFFLNTILLLTLRLFLFPPVDRPFSPLSESLTAVNQMK